MRIIQKRHYRDRHVAVIGDIHGSARLLEELVDKLRGSYPGIRMFCLGDVCDRGPRTKRVMDLLLKHDIAGVMGNHDLWFLRWAMGNGFDSSALGDAMGGSATLRSYGVEGRSPRVVEDQRWRVPRHHWRFLSLNSAALDLQVDDQAYWVVHAGISKDVELPRGLSQEAIVPWLAENRPLDLLLPSRHPRDSMPLDRSVIMGHRVLQEPLDLGFVIGIDTGAGTRPDGRLTAVVLPERTFVSVPEGQP